MTDEHGRIVDFEEEAQARRPAAQRPKRTLAILFLLLLALSLLLGFDGRILSAIAHGLTSAQCRLEIQADRLLAGAGERRRVHPCELAL